MMAGGEEGADLKDLTETQSRAFAAYMGTQSVAPALEELSQKYGGDLTALGAKADVIVRGMKTDTLVSDQIRQIADPDVRRYMLNEATWINGVLRQESGAAIKPEEYELLSPQYFPRPGDTPEMIADKARNRKMREMALEAMIGKSGQVYAADIQGQIDAYGGSLGTASATSEMEDHYNTIN